MDGLVETLFPDIGYNNSINVASTNSFNFKVCLQSICDYIYPLLLTASPYCLFFKDNPFLCYVILPSMGLCCLLVYYGFKSTSL